MGSLGFARRVEIEPNFDSWRNAARELLAGKVAPEEIVWADSEGAPSLFAAEDVEQRPADGGRAVVPRSFVERARFVACHRNADRWELLYRILWRLQGDHHLLSIEIDDDVALFRRYEMQVRRDLHKMHAFVRFRKIVEGEGEHGVERFVAWYQPEHRVLELAAPFFAERFAVMRWSILTPDGSVHWDPSARAAAFGPGVPRSSAPGADELETLWKTYYRSIFNPARLNTQAMRAEMPTRYWKNLPEIDTLPNLLREAGGRVDSMIASPATTTAEPFVPAVRELPVLRAAISSCRGCNLYCDATQAVFGEGPAQAEVVLVGEQPGDEEDRRGMPFVGPAGRLFNEVLAELQVDRGSLYITNAVKHFKFTQRGKRRLHQTPRLSEVIACRPWLLAELEALRPKVVVCLGASASKSLLGSRFQLMRDRGKAVACEYAPQAVATLHPSAILRAVDPARGSELRAMLTADLRYAFGLVA